MCSQPLTLPSHGSAATEPTPPWVSGVVEQPVAGLWPVAGCWWRGGGWVRVAARCLPVSFPRADPALFSLGTAQPGQLAAVRHHLRRQPGGGGQGEHDERGGGLHGRCQDDRQRPDHVQVGGGSHGRAQGVQVLRGEVTAALGRHKSLPLFLISEGHGGGLVFPRAVRAGSPSLLRRPLDHRSLPVTGSFPASASSRS